MRISIPKQLLVILIFVLLFGSSLPFDAVRLFYTLSLIIKDLLLFVLPLAVAAYIAATLISFRNQAIWLVVLLFLFEGVSNGVSVFYAYGVGYLFQDLVPLSAVSEQALQEIRPFLSLADYRPSVWSADKGVMVGVIIGLGLSFLPIAVLQAQIFKLRDAVAFIFSKIFVRFIPLYLLGFFLFMQHSGLLQRIIQTYVAVILLVSLTICLYLAVLLLIAAKGNKNQAYTIFKNIWPSGLIAFTSTSSAATMPFTIEAAKKNLRNPSFAEMLIAATTNIQQIGDCIANALLCLVILKSFGKPIPDMSSWLVFMGAFVLARYTTAAVIGGAIFIMIGIYERYLGFTGEMIALILALNIVLDPIITSTNVLANGILAVIFERLWLIFNPSNATLHMSAAEKLYKVDAID